MIHIMTKKCDTWHDCLILVTFQQFVTVTGTVAWYQVQETNTSNSLKAPINSDATRCIQMHQMTKWKFFLNFQTSFKVAELIHTCLDNVSHFFPTFLACLDGFLHQIYEKSDKRGCDSFTAQILIYIALSILQF